MMNINLLPWRQNEKNKKIRSFFSQTKSVLVLIILIIIILCIRDYQGLFMQQRIIEDLKYKMASVNPRDDKFLEFFYSKNGEKSIDFIENKIKENTFLLDALFFMGKEIPNNMYLSKIEKKENVLYFSGKAISQLDVIFFVKMAENKFTNKKILIDEINRVNNNENYKIDFVISLIL